MAFHVEEKKGCRVTKINALYQREYTRVFLVETGDSAFGCLAARTAAGVPQVGASYALAGARPEFDRGSFVNSVEARETSEAGDAWDVTVQYGPYNPATFGQDPMAWPIRISWSTQKYDRPVYEDINGNAVVNSAGDGFAEPVTADENRSILVVTRNERVKDLPADPTANPPTPAQPGFDVTLAKQFENRTNMYRWNNADPGTVKLNSITPGEAQQSPDGVWYYAVVYTFEENLDGWKKTLLDQGFAELDASAPPVAKQIKGKDGQPINEPVPLDGSGHKLVHGSPPVYLTFEVYREIDFDPLNIDLSTALGHS